MTQKRILLVDGHGIAFRAFYALPPLSSSAGTPTNVLVGFGHILGRARKDWNPDEIYVAFDAKGPTFRHELSQSYKATRKPTPQEFSVQIPLLQQMLTLAGITIMARQGVEADDLLASAARQITDGQEALILSSDKDMMQVLRQGVKMLRPQKARAPFKVIDLEAFQEEYGFPPQTMVDYLALTGDTVDNIQGIDGVGDKTARRLLSKYGSIEGILSHLEELTASQASKFSHQGAQALENRKLTALKCDEDLSEFFQQRLEPRREELLEFCASLDINAKVAAELLCQGGSPSTAERISYHGGSGAAAPIAETVLELHPDPADRIPLTTLLEAPRLALDLQNGSGEDGPVLASLCSSNGCWWEGPAAELRSLLETLMARPVICSDAKALCAAMDLDQLGSLWDLKTAHYLLHPDKEDHGLEALSQLPFSAERTLRLFGLRDQLGARLEELKLTALMEAVDGPLIPVLVAMERWGIGLDGQGLAQVGQELEAAMAQAEGAITEASGARLNLNSPKQVGQLLFEKLQLPAIKKTKTGYSTNTEVLEQLDQICGSWCPVPRLILEHRELSKMLTGFVQPLGAAAGPGGLIHGTFEAQTTGTGRLSCRDPNLQNLPAYSQWGNRIRSCLKPRKEGHCFVAADYSQIELRVLAHISGDPRLQEIFQGDRDIHTEMASAIFSIPAQEVTKELRRAAKTVSFGLLYGMSAFGLASRLAVGRSQAQEIVDAYFRALPGVKEYMEESYRRAQQRGYTQTLFGRIRPLDEVGTGNASDKGHLKRVAINSPIQGTAADITKIAMIAVSRRFAGRDVAMVLQVHDSIVCECPFEDGPAVAAELAEAMASAASLSVPLKTETKTGPTLAEI